MTNALLVISLFILLVTSGCSSSPKYGVGFFNNTDRNVSEANIEYGTFRFRGNNPSAGGGVVVTKSSSTYEYIGQPIPEHARASWRTADGVLHEQEVQVRSRLPKGFSGMIYFRIEKDNSITVVPIRYGEERSIWDLSKG